METVLGDVAHGGVIVARIDGKVTFVAGGLPGERVEVEITQSGVKFDRGRVLRVIDAHEQRVTPSCPVAGECGGCDWQHASSGLQLELKRRVVAEQLRRLGGIDWSGVVEQVSPVWGWRTRMRYAVGRRLGLRAARSRQIVELPEQGCLIAARVAPQLTAGEEVVVTDARSGRSVFVDGRLVQGEPIVTERAGGRDYLVAGDGFWQIHPAAADTLVQTVLSQLQVEPGESAVDLYCGVGLFAGAMASAGARVLGVELNSRAIALARRNVPEGRFAAASVDAFVHKLPRHADLVVLDPPRKGAGRRVVEAVSRMKPRVISYVACDPAALGRDLGYFQANGYAAQEIRAFDLFPQTHHMECVARIIPADGPKSINGNT